MCQEYKKILELKMQRGRSVNKVDALQNLAKAWWLSNKEGNSGKLMKNIQWESAWIKDMIWAEKKQQVKEQEELSTHDQLGRQTTRSTQDTQTDRTAQALRHSTTC